MHWVLMGNVFSTWAGEENLKAIALINEDKFCRYKLLLYIYIYITYTVIDIFIGQFQSLFYRRKLN